MAEGARRLYVGNLVSMTAKVCLRAHLCMSVCARRVCAPQDVVGLEELNFALARRLANQAK
jgi:hypothetical protein